MNNENSKEARSLRKLGSLLELAFINQYGSKDQKEIFLGPFAKKPVKLMTRKIAAESKSAKPSASAKARTKHAQGTRRRNTQDEPKKTSEK